MIKQAEMTGHCYSTFVEKACKLAEFGSPARTRAGLANMVGKHYDTEIMQIKKETVLPYTGRNLIIVSFHVLISWSPT